MEMNYIKNEISVTKTLNNLDTFVFQFVAILETLEIPYVLMAGYIAILFGR